MKLRSLHPILLAVTPVLFLFAHNAEQVPAEDLARPITLLIVLALVLSTLAKVAFGNWEKGTIFVSILLSFFFGYGFSYFQSPRVPY